MVLFWGGVALFASMYVLLISIKAGKSSWVDIGGRVGIIFGLLMIVAGMLVKAKQQLKRIAIVSSVGGLLILGIGVTEASFKLGPSSWVTIGGIPCMIFGSVMMVTAFICFAIEGGLFEAFESMDGIFDLFTWCIVPALCFLGSFLHIVAIVLLHVVDFLSNALIVVKWAICLIFWCAPVGCFIVQAVILYSIVNSLVNSGGLWTIFGWVVAVVGSTGIFFITLIVYVFWQEAREEQH